MSRIATSVLAAGAMWVCIAIGLGIGFGLGFFGFSGSSLARAADTAPSSAAAKTGAAATTTAKPTVAIQTVVYRPPARGKPRARVGGGVRGAGASVGLRIRALVPDHTGLTTQGRPVLLFYVSRALSDDAKLIFSLLDEQSLDPLVETSIPVPDRRGIGRIDLAKLGIELERDVEYEWTISVVERARVAVDIQSGGFIDRISPAVPAPSPSDVRALAAAGLWYDALAAADDAVRRDPRNAAATEIRSALLSQVGLVLD